MTSENKPEKLDIDVCRAFKPDVEVRSDGDSPRTMSGHFSVFDNFYEINSAFEGHFLERIAPGAFRKTFKEQGDRIRVLLEHGHDPTVADKPLGKPVKMEEDETGARYDVELFDTSYVRDLIPALEAGVYGSSFRFRAMKDDWDYNPERSSRNPEGIPERTITEVKVMEFGPTIFPANPEATASLRSTTDEYYEELRSRNPEQYDEVVRSLSRTVSTSESGESDDESFEAEGTGSDENRTEEPAKEAAPTVERKEVDSTTPKEGTNTMSDDQKMTVEEREARLSEIRARFSEIDEEFSGAALDEERRSEWDTLTEEYDAHERAIEDARRRQEQIRNLGEKTGSTQRGSGNGSPAFHKKPENIYDLGAIRNQARNVDDIPTLYRENAMRAIETGRYSSRHVSKEDAQARAEHLLNTVDNDKGDLARRILVTGSPTYERAFGKAVLQGNTMGLNGEEQRALSMGAADSAALAVPFQLDPTVVLTSDGSINPLRSLARVESIVGKTWQGVTSAGIVVSRAAEATEATDDAPTFSQPEVTPTRVQGFVPFSVEADQDWTALRSEMTRLLADAKDQEEADSFINGDGVAPNPNGLVATLAAGSEVLGQSAAGGGGITVEDIYNLKNALPPRFRSRGQFLAETSVYDEVRQLANGSDGADLWVRLQDGRPALLIGYNAHEASEMEADLTVAGNRVLLFGDYSQFLIVDKVGMNVELVPHLFGATNRFPTGQRGLYALWRNNSLVLADNAFRVLTIDA